VGRFSYGDAIRTEFDDRLLAHLQAVVSTKLRRQEPFCFTWTNSVDLGGGRTAVWVHPGAHLVFSFTGRPPRLNRAWLERLMVQANSPAGLMVVPEPTDTPDEASDLEASGDLVG
jgi:hypothetical protein